MVSWIRIKKETNPLGDTSLLEFKVVKMFKMQLSMPLYSNKANNSVNFFYPLWYLKSNLYKKLIIPSLNP